MAVKERAGFKCEWCGATKYLNSHHIIGKRFAPFRYELHNGICLCPRCHKFGIGYSAHENPLCIVMWLLDNREDSLIWLGTRWKEYLPEEVIKGFSLMKEE